MAFSKRGYFNVGRATTVDRERAADLRPAAREGDAGQRRLARVLGESAHFVRQPTFLTGAALVAVIWLAVGALNAQDRRATQEHIRDDVDNLALVVEESVAHIIRDLDRGLQFLRWTRAVTPANVEWADILGQTFVNGADTAQTSIIGADGFMITSTVALHPAEPIYLGDREHFRVQARAKKDELFISKPVIGRVSGKWSVQFTRRLTDAEDHFAGVVVASLDAKSLARDYDTLNLGDGGGLALVGFDGVVRAGSGAFSGRIGAPFVADETIVDGPGEPRGFIIGERRVEGAPLRVVLTAPDETADLGLTRRRGGYLGLGLAATIATLFATGGMAARRSRADRRLIHYAHRDALTGLPNRRRLEDVLDSIFALPPESRRYALHFVDLDRFKYVNDTHGHVFGGRLLQRAAERLQGAAGASSLVSRIGGDEFAIVQALGAEEDAATALAEAICGGLSEPFGIDGIGIVIGATVGVALASRDAGAASDLMKAADLGLHAAKSSAKGHFRLYDAAMKRAVEERAGIENGLKTAIANGEITLHYQPVVALESGETVGYEALMRWRRPGGAMTPPSEFIPVA